MNNNVALWDQIARPPKEALKTIKGGRLQGMTDVNPQWRYRAMTEQFGPCGRGWKFEIKRLWTEAGSEGQILAFAEVAVYIGPQPWSDPIPGVGGSILIAKEAGGLRSNDEAFKMATTDALSVALKMLGIAADIYAGLWDGSKFRDEPDAGKQPEKKAEAPHGFEQWCDDLAAVAAEGTDKLQAVWKASKPEYRTHLTSTNAAGWESLKALAAKVRVPVGA